MKKICCLLLLFSMLLLCGCSGSFIPAIKDAVQDILEEREPYPVTGECLYYYEQLNEEQQMIYSCLLESRDLQSDTAEFLHPVCKADLQIAKEAFERDYPDVYWMSSYTMYSYGKKEEITSVSFDHADTIAEDLQTVERAALPIVQKAIAAGEDYEAVRIFYDWIIDTCDYRLDAQNNQDIRSVFLNHASVCSGYARAFQYLCRQAGIDCIVVKGEAGGDSHAWNAVWIDGRSYWVDPTWGDPIRSDGEGPSKNYYYFCVDDDTLFRSHTPTNAVTVQDEAIEDVFSIPVCSDDSLDYYVQRDCCFSEYNSDEFRWFLYRHFENGIREDIEVRFRSAVSFDRAYRDLITENKSIEGILLDWYKTGLRYTYSADPDACVLTLSVYPQ